MKKILRSIQTLFPFLHDLRFRVKFLIMKLGQKPHENDFNALKLFKPQGEQVFVDIGSNRGEAISSMLIMGNPEIPIIGFEPNPLIFAKLKSHFSGNERILVHNLGLANENNEHFLYVPFYRKWMFDGLASFKYESAKDWLKTRLWLYDEKKLTVKKIKCQIRKLDDFHLSPYFIKIDVQGYELEVLMGGAETIINHSPIILIESIEEKHKKILAPLGYKFYHFRDGKMVDGNGELNTFCLNPKKHTELFI